LPWSGARRSFTLFSSFSRREGFRRHAGLSGQPLAIRATEIFRRHREYFDDETKKILQNGEDPLSLPQLRFTETSQESMSLNALAGRR